MQPANIWPWNAEDMPDCHSTTRYVAEAGGGEGPNGSTGRTPHEGLTQKPKARVLPVEEKSERRDKLGERKSRQKRKKVSNWMRMIQLSKFKIQKNSYPSVRAGGDGRKS